VDDVLSGMGSDTRIGKRFLQPGPGWGGSCFPKDTRALVAVANDYGVSLGVVDAAIESNVKSISRVVMRLKSLLDNSLSEKRIAVWGLAFKANTDDTRDSPALEIISMLLREGSEVVAFDPKAFAPNWPGLTQAESAVSSTIGANALLVLTEWNEFKTQDPIAISQVMAGSVVFDTRRILPKNLWDSVFSSFNVLGQR